MRQTKQNYSFKDDDDEDDSGGDDDDVDDYDYEEDGDRIAMVTLIMIKM